MHSNAKSYLEIAQGKQEQRQKRIPKAWLLSQDQLQTRDILSLPENCGILTARELHITQECDAVDIIDEIASGKLSAREVAVAFCKRAAIAQQMVRFRPFRNIIYSFLTRPDQLPYRGLLRRGNPPCRGARRRESIKPKRPTAPASRLANILERQLQDSRIRLSNRDDHICEQA
jgi:hypothetical protein